MRPPGEVREALREAFRRLGDQQGAASWRDALPLLQHVGIDPRSVAEVRLVRKTVERMVSAGELQVAGRTKAAGKRTWCALYEPAAPVCARPGRGRAAHGEQAFVDLARATRAWTIR